MRLPFPEHIPLTNTFYFAAVLCAIQQFQGTSAAFSLLCFFYIIVASIAFNLAGGFTRPTGAFVFFTAFLSVILGLCVKILLGEPADSNLLMPILTMGVLLAGMCMMTVAVFLSGKVTTKKALLGTMVSDANMQTATVGCMLAGIFMVFAGFVLPGGNGTVLSALNQMNRFFPLAIALGVIHTIRRSGGTRSINLPVLLSAAIMFFNGVVAFSKEGMFAPLATYVLAAASQRYKVNRIQIFWAVLVTIFLIRYLVPYSQYGRTYKTDSLGGDISVSLGLLSDLGSVREEYLKSSAGQYEERIYGYFNTPQGLFDRLQMLSIDDALIAHTAKYGPYGTEPILISFENLVPHFIWRDKPQVILGNIYAHEVGILGEQDNSTGVSFSSTSTSFHLLGWPGIFFLAPALWFCLFTIFDSLCGDVRKTPWGLLVLVLYAHAAPEGDIGSIVYMCCYTTYGIIFAAIIGTYAMPILGTLLIGPEGISIRRGPPIRSIPNRLIPSASTKI
jgi:hypothetical protein